MPLLEHLGIDLADESAKSALALVVVTVVATVAFLHLARAALYPPGQPVIPNPLLTKIPQLSEKEVANLEYKPDAYPGARDVLTPVCTTMARVGWIELSPRVSLPGQPFDSLIPSTNRILRIVWHYACI